MKARSHSSAKTRAAVETVSPAPGLSRREFVQTFGIGVVISIVAGPSIDGFAAARGGGGGRSQRIGARVHIGADGAITVFTGKVEGGNGARTELTQAAAEELRVLPGDIKLIMADTDLVPDDGITAGSRSTPSTVPAVRRGAAAARHLLENFAAARWNVPASEIKIADGKARHGNSSRTLGYGDLASSPDFERDLAASIPSDVVLTPVGNWKTLGHSTRRANGVDIVTGAHKYPSDIRLPGMFYGKVLRRPSYGARLLSVDLDAGKTSERVVVVRDGEFVGVAAPSSFEARQALARLAATAKWETASHPSGKEVFEYLRSHTARPVPANSFTTELKGAKVVRRSYHVSYVQHAPLEPRAAVAEWKGDKLTVWTGSQNPFGCRGELVRVFNLSENDVRVIIPDFGGGFGGKHTPDAHVEAARLAKAAGRPVAVHWTRQEEFTWAYFRPAAVVDAESTLDANKAITSWHFVNINSGGAAIDTPYRCGRKRCEYVPSRTPMRQGSYRALAAAANTFARESFMDELALEAGVDPLEFRLAHLDNPRLRAVLEAAAARFRWEDCLREKKANFGYGLACSTEKGSFVATCTEVELVGPAKKEFAVRRICEVFECGAILNPANLFSQVRGQIIMALGPALQEEMLFENGEVLNASFRGYQVPRFADVPQLDIHFLNRPDLDAVGGGETPLIAVAPAIANAVFHASGIRVREMPIRLPV